MPHLRRPHLYAGLVGAGTTVLLWMIPLLSALLGLVLGMPREYGGLGHPRIAPVAAWGLGVVLIAGVLVLVKHVLSACHVARPWWVAVSGIVLTAVLVVACSFPADHSSGWAAVVLVPLCGAFSFTAAARITQR